MLVNSCAHILARFAQDVFEKTTRFDSSPALIYHASLVLLFRCVIRWKYKFMVTILEYIVFVCFQTLFQLAFERLEMQCIGCWTPSKWVLICAEHKYQKPAPTIL